MCRHRTPAPGMFYPRTLGPHCGQPGPHTGGSGSHMWRSWTKLGGLDRIYRGPAPSHWGPDSLVMPQSMSLSLDTWRHRTRPCGGVRCCRWPRVVARGLGESWPGPTYNSFTTRRKIVAWVLRFYTAVRGTLVSGYRQWPPSPPQGRMRACRRGQSLYFASTWPDR
jgi:hypothetical protein